MRVLVTGGSGFIGGYTVDRLLERGHEPLVFDRSPHEHGLPEGAEVFLGDIRDSEALVEAMAHVDGWVHLAGVLGTQETIRNPRPAASTNILGGLNVLEAAAQYELPGVNIAVGNWWMNNTYSLTKNCVERFCAMYREERGLAVTTVRALNAYGPRQSVAAPFGPSKVRKIMPAFVCRSLLGQPIEIYGDGEQVMDMIYVADVARVLVQALEFTAATGGTDDVLEAGSGVSTTVLDIASAVRTEAGSSAPVEFVPMRPGEPPNSIVLGNPETLGAIDFDPASLRSLASGVAETVEWFRESWFPAYRDR